MQESIFKITREFPMFSLQKLCLIKISSIICNDQQLLGLIKKVDFCRNYIPRLGNRKCKAWKAVQVKAKEIILKICNSVFLRDGILELLWPMSYKIILWIHTYAPYIDDEFPPIFYWTHLGRIDTIRTAQQVIKNKNFSNQERFRLASSLCLSKEIGELWSKMSKKDKKHFSTKHLDKFCPLNFFWVHTMEGSAVADEQYMQVVLKCAMRYRLFEAITYLFRLMTGDPKYHTIKNGLIIFCLSELESKIANEAFLEEVEIEICYFLLSEIQFTDETRNLRYKLLTRSLLFHSSKYENLLKVLLKEDEFCYVGEMFLMIFQTYHMDLIPDNDYRSLFFHYWLSISASAKNYIATETYIGTIFLAVLIKYDFPFLLKKGAFQKVAELTASNFKCSTSGRSPSFQKEKWEFLLFLIQERVVIIPTLKMWLRRFIKSDRDALRRVLRFVSKFGNISQQQEP